MTEPCLIDNDIALKVAAYQLTDDFVNLFTIDNNAPAMLEVGRFVVRRKAAKNGRFRDTEAVTKAIENLLSQVTLIEPNDSEIAVAADLEALALDGNLNLDTGEAQLLAILISRSGPALLTGDKRAIRAISSLSIEGAQQRLVCLEQVFSRLLSIRDAEALRICVCLEPSADKALALCFSCASITLVETDVAGTKAALDSYIADLRKNSGTLLMDNDAVSSLTA